MKKNPWKQIHEIAHKKISKENIIGIRNGNKTETDPVTIGNDFNNFFTTIAEKTYIKIYKHNTF